MNFVPICKQFRETNNIGQETDMYVVPAGRAAIISSFLASCLTVPSGEYRAGIVLDPTTYPPGDIVVNSNIVTPEASWLTEWMGVYPSNPFVQTLGIVMPAGAAFRVICYPDKLFTFHLWGQEVVL